MNNFEHIHSHTASLSAGSQAPSLPCSHLMDDSAVSDSTIITSHAMLHVTLRLLRVLM